MTTVTKRRSGDDTLVDRVRAALRGVRPVKEQKMFGSIGFMVRGKLCVAARPERIMCRIDPATHGDAVKRKGVHAVVMKGRQYKGYVRVDANALTTQRAVAYWVSRALKFNRTLPSSARRVR